VVAASGHNLISHVLREWNDLDGALRHAREGIALCVRWGWPEGLALGYWRLARVLQATGDELGALEAMQNAGQAASDLSPWFGELMAVHHARLWLAQGRLTPASHWARESGLRVDDELNFQDLDGYAVLARVLIAEGKTPEALRLLARLVDKTEAAGAMGYLIEALVLQAVALQTQAAGDQAIAPLERALTLAEPEGFVRVFVDEGASMDRLLRQAVIQGLAAAYAGKLLVALDRETVNGAPPEAELLSPRETEVLRLLTTHLSHSEMAEELVVSVNTVRSHIKSIYGKLDVHSRMEAIERGRELGLLA
jgi:LuxR family maltose regulon positive regulatory protein